MKIFRGSEVSFWVRVGKFLQYGFLCGARVSPIASIAKEEIVGSLNVEWKGTRVETLDRRFDDPGYIERCVEL